MSKTTKIKKTGPLKKNADAAIPKHSNPQTYAQEALASKLIKLKYSGGEAYTGKLDLHSYDATPEDHWKVSEPADKVVISNPVPEHMLYQEGSAAGEDTDIAFSVDNGTTYDVPEKLTIVDDDGKERPAKGADYTHIRWTLQKSMAPEEKGLVTFRAQLK